MYVLFAESDLKERKTSAVSVTDNQSMLRTAEKRDCLCKSIATSKVQDVDNELLHVFILLTITQTERTCTMQNGTLAYM